MVPKYPVSVKAVIEKNGKFMMIKGLWDGKESLAFPGGLVEYGESLESALIREVKEEVGLLVEPENIFYATKYSHPKGGENIGIYFRAKLVGGSVKLTGEDNAIFTSLVWLSKKDAPLWVQQILDHW